MVESNHKQPTKKAKVPDSVRQKGLTARTERGIFNRYIRALNGPSAQKNSRKLAELNAMIETGTRLKNVALFEGGRRVGTVAKRLPLLPSEMATLLVQRARLEHTANQPVSDELRRQFLKMLPSYALRNEFSYEILIAVGVPADDLDEAGIKPQ